MKMSIEWHKRALYNRKQSEETHRKNLLDIQAAVDTIAQQNIFYERQIDEAIKQKKDGFDSDKFLVQKRKYN